MYVSALRPCAPAVELARHAAKHSYDADVVNVRDCLVFVFSDLRCLPTTINSHL